MSPSPARGELRFVLPSYTSSPLVPHHRRRSPAQPAASRLLHDLPLTHSDIKTCPTCMGNFASCRKAEFSATEGIERAVKPADA